MTETDGRAIESRLTASVPARHGAAGVMRWLALGGMIAPIVFVVTFTVAGILRPGYSPIHQAISDLGVGPRAWMLNWTGLGACVLLTAFVIAFTREIHPASARYMRWLSAVLLELPILGLATACVFTEAPATLAIHWEVGASLFFFVPFIGFPVTGWMLRRVPGWRNWGMYTLLAGPLTLLLVALMVWAYIPASSIGPDHLGGAGERLVMFEVLAWYAVTGRRLFRRITTDAADRRRPLPLAAALPSGAAGKAGSRRSAART